MSNDDRIIINIEINLQNHDTFANLFLTLTLFKLQFIIFYL